MPNNLRFTKWITLLIPIVFIQCTHNGSQPNLVSPEVHKTIAGRFNDDVLNELVVNLDSSYFQKQNEKKILLKELNYPYYKEGYDLYLCLHIQKKDKATTYPFYFMRLNSNNQIMEEKNYMQSLKTYAYKDTVTFFSIYKLQHEFEKQYPKCTIDIENDKHVDFFLMDKGTNKYSLVLQVKGYYYKTTSPDTTQKTMFRGEYIARYALTGKLESKGSILY